MANQRVAVLLVALTLFSASPASAQERPPCSGFSWGFKSICDEIPDIVGAWVETEHHEGGRYDSVAGQFVDGNTLQRTTGGLFVWRKSDNFTAFTDGYWTWVNGPYGLQERLNSERFEWESDPPERASEAAREVPTAPTTVPIAAPPPSVSESPANLQDARDELLYSPWNPERAMQNVLRDLGLDRGPLASMFYEPRAKGLAMTFFLKQALDPTASYVSAGTDYKNYLYSAVSNGSLGNELQDGYALIGGGQNQGRSALIDLLTRVRAGETATNPYRRDLYPILSNVEGVGEVVYVLLRPTMGESLARGGQSLVLARERHVLEQIANGSPKHVLELLFGD